MRVRLRAGDGSTIDAIAFRAAGKSSGSALAQSRGRIPVHAAGTLCVDRWNGVERVQFRLIDWRRPTPASAFIRSIVALTSASTSMRGRAREHARANFVPRSWKAAPINRRAEWR